MRGVFLAHRRFLFRPDNESAEFCIRLKNPYRILSDDHASGKIKKFSNPRGCHARRKKSILEAVLKPSFCRFSGLFWPVFDSFVGGNINLHIYRTWFKNWPWAASKPRGSEAKSEKRRLSLCMTSFSMVEADVYPNRAQTWNLGPIGVKITFSHFQSELREHLAFSEECPHFF